MGCVRRLEIFAELEILAEAGISVQRGKAPLVAVGMDFVWELEVGTH